jgi:lipoprotein-anchoring transpeptidase ErfK/SrfK
LKHLWLGIALLLLTGTASAAPPIEIWLGARYGRFGPYEFPALGGKKTHPTPKGTFRVHTKHKDFYSNKYKAPMPFSLFFTSQCAIHAGSLRVMSHGCIHVDRQTAEFLYYYAPKGTKVIVHP